jgi:hypothetical protein
MSQTYTLPCRYNLNQLHQSVNDIYEQYDEGRITKTQANEILLRCCFQFVNDNRNHPNKKEGESCGQ